LLIPEYVYRRFGINLLLRGAFQFYGRILTTAGDLLPEGGERVGNFG
jgi:hypothetical protein